MPKSSAVDKGNRKEGDTLKKKQKATPLMRLRAIVISSSASPVVPALELEKEGLTLEMKITIPIH